MFDLIVDGSEPLDLHRELLKRELDRVHAVLVNPLGTRTLMALIMDDARGRVSLSDPTRRFVERVIQRNLVSGIRDIRGGPPRLKYKRRYKDGTIKKKRVKGKYVRVKDR